ncbi:MAG: MBL fold metallo-hydrolase [Pseudomonadota bacterium]
MPFAQTTSIEGLYVVDAEYYQPELASIHLLCADNEIAIIDTGTNDSVASVERALQELGLHLQQVRYVVLTHIHLDHAGGASALMKICPNAQLVVHPRGARHMIDPTKLIAGSIAVYGEKEFARLYGTIDGIPSDRVVVPQDEESLTLGDKTLTFYDTPGHASHHYSIHVEEDNIVFTGDTLGIGYRALRNEQHAFVCPSTTPVQFDPQALHSSIERVAALSPDYLYLTHYSELKPTTRIIAGLHEQIDDFVTLTEQVMNGGDELQLAEDLTDYLVTRASNELPSINPELMRHWLQLDGKLSAQGLAFWWQHRR